MKHSLTLKYFVEEFKKKKDSLYLAFRNLGKEFGNKAFEDFCALNGYTQNFSSPHSSQQNG